MIKIFNKSILAGLMIAIGTIVYMNASAIVGAFMFSIGLLSIFQLNLYLFTGIVSYTNSLKELPFILTVLIGNAVGCCLMFLFPNEAAKEIVTNKLDSNYIMMFVAAMLCNILIYVAVEANKKSNTLTVILAVATFIVCGFNHSIANICFVISSRIFNLDSMLLILVSIVGNSIGGILCHKARCDKS